MKRSVSIFLFVFSSAVIFSQKKDPCYAGVYLTEEDFVKNRLSHKIDKSAKGFDFGFPVPADLKLEIKITKPDTTLRFKPGSVYGYNECGKVFRYSAGGELLATEDYYRLEEIKGLVIYTSAFNSGDEYFYSRSLSSKIHRLNLKNIEEDFKDQPAFVDAVKTLNKEGERGNLEKRDEKGDFIINQLYKEKVQKKNKNAR
jgi:hypothetical protein